MTATKTRTAGGAAAQKHVSTTRKILSPRRRRRTCVDLVESKASDGIFGQTVENPQTVRDRIDRYTELSPPGVTDSLYVYGMKSFPAHEDAQKRRRRTVAICRHRVTAATTAVEPE